ncbi:MAG: FAD/NAD(P)-binding protein [Chloroflexi bacterium]|nr:FAD/NAD(P)-binding protein [Chloroflexota bacterium]
MSNPLLPHLATLTQVKDLAVGIRLFRCKFNDSQVGANFDYRPGQFGFLSAFGVGESPFGLTSTKGRLNSEVEFAVARVGTVTAALHELEEGDTVGIRGPYGNWFPLDEVKGKRIIIIGGGIGMAPLRPVIQTIIDNRRDYDELILLCAARQPNLLVFKEEYDEWAAAPNTRFHVTVDVGDNSWKGNVGLITKLLADVAPTPDNAVAITCGPPIMIKFVLKGLKELGFTPEQIVTTLESKMKCGIGKCGRCNVGERYICLDGPVFRYDQILKFLEEF